MVIRASSAAQINALVADLGSNSAITRDAAIARLTVIGARAVERLCDVAAGAPLDARLAALRALEGIGSPRAFDTAVVAVQQTETAAAAIALLRRLLHGPKETQAIETLTAVALDQARSAPVRIAAAQALADLDPSAFAPLGEQLERDAVPELNDLAKRFRTHRADAAEAGTPDIETLAERGLVGDAAAVRRAIARDGATAPLTALRRLVEAIRQREESASPRERPEWAAARAAAHVALAARGSRIALYDLRESIEQSTGPLPVEFLAAVTDIGDASCLEPLAAAYARSTGSGDEWWPRHLRHAFHTIAQRHRISQRHAAMRKVIARWPAIVR